MGHLHPRALTGVPVAIVAHVPAAVLRIALSRIALAVGAAGRVGAANPAPAPHLHRAVVVASASGARPLINVRCARPRPAAGACRQGVIERNRSSRGIPNRRDAGGRP